MKTLTQQLSQYAAYHRDKRNIHTHFVGIPMIVFAVLILLSRPALDLGLLTATPALLAVVLSSAYYLVLDRRYGLVMLTLLVLLLLLARPLAEGTTTLWLGWGIGLFVIGWIIQFIGHYYEGRKPAFVDDLIGLAIGPLFVVAEAGFLLGLRPEVEKEIIYQVGPTLIREHLGRP